MQRSVCAATNLETTSATSYDGPVCIPLPMSRKYPMKQTYALCLALAFSAASSQASEFDFNISDESVNGSVALVPAGSSVDFGAGYIYEKGGTHIGNADFHARGRTALGNLPATVGVGVQLNVFEADPIDGGALGIGGYTHLKIPTVPGL